MSQSTYSIDANIKGNLSCNAVKCTTITTNNNTINAGTGTLTCGTISSSTITSINTTVNGHTSDITSLNSTVAGHTTSINTNTASINTNTTNINTNTNNIATNATNITSLQTKVNTKIQYFSGSVLADGNVKILTVIPTGHWIFSVVHNSYNNICCFVNIISNGTTFMIGMNNPRILVYNMTVNRDTNMNLTIQSGANYGGNMNWVLYRLPTPSSYVPSL